MVRDHANADELRGARTLSGGETFLASLVARPRPRRRDERARRRGRAEAGVDLPRRGLRHARPGDARRRRRCDRGARRGRSDGRRRDAHPRARRAHAGAPRGHQGRGVVDGRAGRRLMRFSVETWAPEYGASIESDVLARHDRAGRRRRSSDRSATGRRSPPTAVDRPRRILFVDGVRRIDARIWIADGDRAFAGVCASVAAGVVSVRGGDRGGRRRVGAAIRHRAGAASADDITTRHAPYAHVPLPTDDPAAVYLAIHDRMTALEHDGRRRRTTTSSCSTDRCVAGPTRAASGT